MESAFIKIFGDTPFNRVFDMLLDHPNLDYSKKELAGLSGMSESTLYGMWNKLERLGIVIPTRKFGKAQLYKLNPKSKIVKETIRYEKEIQPEIEAVAALPEFGHPKRSMEA